MTINKELVALKLAVIKYHNSNAYLETSMARDACFVSFNSMQWKKTGQGQMLDTTAEIKELLPQRGQDTADTKLERLLDKYEQMETELNILEERHIADKAVYREITGEDWTAKPKRTYTSEGMGIDSRLAKFGIAS